MFVVWSALIVGQHERSIDDTDAVAKHGTEREHARFGSRAAEQVGKYVADTGGAWGYIRRCVMAAPFGRGAALTRWAYGI